MEKINRRQFISQFGLATAAMCVSPRFAFAKPLASDKKIRLGVVFSSTNIPTASLKL